MKKDYSVLTDQDFLEYSHQELAMLQLTSLDKKISKLRKLFTFINLLIIFPFVLSLIFKVLILPLISLLILTFICVKIKQKIDLKVSIRDLMYNFFKQNDLI